MRGRTIAVVVAGLAATAAPAAPVRVGQVDVAWGGVPADRLAWRPDRIPSTWHRPAGDLGPLNVRFAVAAGDGRLALFSDRIRERYRISLNGAELYRSNADAADRSFAWHRPLLLPLPPPLLRPTGNVITLEIEAAAGHAFAVGTLLVGPEADLRPVYRRTYFLSVTGPETVTGVMLILSAGALIFWLVRPSERVFGWLAIVGVLWALFNTQYFLDAAPIDDAVYWALNADTIFLVFAATLSFAATFLDIARRRGFIIGSAAISGLGLALRHGLIVAGLPATPAYFIMWPLGGVTSILFALACVRAATVENLVMLGATLVALVFGFHDLVFVASGWPGVGFQLQPYGGLLMFLAFGFALGRRVLVALATVENINNLLEQRVGEATSQLRHSESERRRLEVTRAVDGERERLMREIHDGIGSSLIRALAVAQRERQSPNTIETLQRSIADLRIGIDSLEPIGGDVIMLLATLRHRTERELNNAGLTFVWKAMSAPPLPWLDAVGALHILRILQEGISNVLKHADATEIAIDCIACRRDDRDGVLVTLADNGRGMHCRPSTGNGLGNMAARAAALNASFEFGSGTRGGTALDLWLPLDRG